MAYRLNTPLTKNKTYRIWIKHLLPKVLNDVSDNVRLEYDPNPYGIVSRSIKTMPFTNAKYEHRANGWSVCKQFWEDCIDRTSLKEFPDRHGGTIQRPNGRINKADLDGIKEAFGNDANMLFAISMLANQATEGGLMMGLNGQLNGQAIADAVIHHNKKKIVISGNDSHEIRVIKGKHGRAEVHLTQSWSNRNCIFGMYTDRYGTVTVGDLGVNQVTLETHLVLKSTKDAIKIDVRPSWARARFVKYSTGGLFSSSASPEEMVEDLVV